MRKINGYGRETLEEAGYEIAAPPWNGEVILRSITEPDKGKLELWTRNDHFAGYAIVIDGHDYEFVTSNVT